MKQFFSSLILRLISSGSTLLFTFISTKIYGLNLIGEFGLFLGLAVILQIIFSFGMETTFFLTINNANDKNKYTTIKYLFRNHLKFSLPLATLFFLTFYKIDYAIFIVLIALIISRLQLNAYYFRTRSVNSFIFFQHNNINLFSIPFLFAIPENIDFMNPIIISFCLGSVIFLILSQIRKITYSNSKVLNDSGSDNSLSLSKQLNESKEYFFINLINYVFNWIPIFIIYFFLDSLSVGVYYNILKLGSVFLILFFLLETNLMKSLHEISIDFTSKAYHHIKRTKKLILLLSLIILMIFVLQSNEILAIIEQDLTVYKPELIIYSLSQIIMILFGPQSQFMKLSKNQNTLRNILIFTSTINVLLSFILIKFLNLQGVFISIFISNLIWNIYLRYFISKNYNFTL